MWAQVSAFFFFFNIYINKSVWVVLETTLRELLHFYLELWVRNGSRFFELI